MFTVYVFLLGLTIGSFVNAVVWRIHEHKSIASGRSMCPHCHHTLAWYDLIPVFSWIMLSARCRYCGKPIAAQYPIVELLTAALFALSAYAFHPATILGYLDFGFWLYYLTTLIILTVYDLHWYLLPDVVLLPAIVAAGLQLVLHVATGGTHIDIGPLVGAVVAGGAFYAIAAVSDGKWMGGGDIKLAFFMGLILGPKNTGVAMILAFNSAAIIGLLLIALKIKKRQDYIPFGPFLAGSTILASLYGQQIINWYLRLTGL